MKAAVVLGAALALVPSAATAETPPVPRGTLVFASTRTPDLHGEIYLYTGRGVLNVSRSPAADRSPAVTPDGRTMAFGSNRGGREAVWTATVTGERMRRLTGPFRTGRVDDLAWDARGRALLFALVGPSGTAELRLVQRAGGPARVLRRGVSFSSWYDLTAWVGRGERIAVGSWRDGVVILDRSGRVLRRHRGMQPLPSSRGELAVVGNVTDPTVSTIDVYAATGKRRASVRAAAAAWHPDGQVLAYVRRDGVWLLPAAGRPTRIVRGRVDPSTVAWSPDGRHVRYRADGLPMLVRPGARPRRSRFDVVSAAWSSDGRIAVRRSPDRGVAHPLASRPSALVDRGAGGACPTVFTSVTWLPRGRLVYVRSRDGGAASDLWTDSAAPGAPRRLVTTDSRWEAAPAWSPDGRRLAYESGAASWKLGCLEDPESSIYLVSAAGTHARRLARTPDGLADRELAWSPDGKHIAFARTPWNHPTDRAGIHVVDVAGGRVTRVTVPSERAEFTSDRAPSWAMDSSRLAFHRDERTVWTVGTEGGGARRLTTGAWPQWSPRDDVLAFVRGRSVFTIRADGTRERRLATLSAAPKGPPRWSPNGARLAVAAGRLLSVVDVSAATARVVASSRAGVASPAWSPDGRWVAYVGRAKPWRSELYLARTHGSRLVVQVTRDLAHVGAPSWRPR